MDDEWPAVCVPMACFQRADLLESSERLVTLGLDRFPRELTDIWDHDRAEGSERRRRTNVELAEALVRRNLVDHGGFVVHCVHRAVMQLSHPVLSSLVCCGGQGGVEVAAGIRNGYEIVPDTVQDGWETSLVQLPGSDLPEWARPGKAQRAIAEGYAALFGSTAAGKVLLSLERPTRSNAAGRAAASHRSAAPTQQLGAGGQGGGRRGRSARAVVASAQSSQHSSIAGSPGAASANGRRPAQGTVCRRLPASYGIVISCLTSPWSPTQGRRAGGRGREGGLPSPEGTVSVRPQVHVYVWEHGQLTRGSIASAHIKAQHCAVG